MKCLEGFRVVPVLVVTELESGLKLCECLCENGLPVAEITFRTPVAAEVIREAAKRFPTIVLGAGTILTTQDLDRAIDAGAKFAVAPGFNPTVVQAAIACRFAFAPGICTPSEIEQAFEMGVRFFKFFPAEAAGGVKLLSALIAPYKHLGIRFMPTGGITPKNAKEYLALPEVACVGGTWIGKDVPHWEKVRETIQEAARL